MEWVKIAPAVVDLTEQLRGHANVFVRAHYVLAISERGLLPVVLPAAPIGTLVPRFVDGATDMMRAIGVPEDALTRERREMDVVSIGRTASRQMLGMITDFGRLLAGYLDGRSCLDASLRLAETPCSPLGMEYPRERTLQHLTPSS